MKARLMVVVAVVSLISGVGMTVGKAVQQPKSDELSPAEALRLMRLLNTAEADSFYSEPKYLSLEQLLRHRFFPGNKVDVALSDSSSGMIKNYRLSVVVTADGKHYAAALVPRDGCGPALFSDESALIYEGRALGCPGQ